MSPVATSTLAVLSAVVAVGLLSFGIHIYRRYDAVGAWSLSLFAVIWGLYFLLDSVVLVTLSSYGATSAVDLQGLVVPGTTELFLIATTPISRLLLILAVLSWLWFVIGYTTRLGRREKSLLLVGAGLVILISALNGLLGALLSLGYIEIPQGLRSDINQFTGLIEVLATGGVIGAGIAQLYRASERHTLFTSRAVAGLAVAILLPYLTIYVYQFGLIVDFQLREMLQLTALSAGSVGLWVAVQREDVFEQLPASNAVGRDTVFENTEAGIVVLNDQRRISDINTAACKLFDVSPNSIVGKPIESLLPEETDPESVYEPGGTTIQFQNSSRIIEAAATVMTDEQGSELGRTVIFTDITDERQRQQRIQVLNRVLRHNLRNELTVAVGYVDMLGDDNVEKRDEYTNRVQSQLDKISRMGDKARDIEKIINVEPTLESPQSLKEVIREAAEDIDTDVSVEIDISEDVATRVSPAILGRVVTELLENAIEHTEASEITISFDEEENVLTVSDNGSGIPETEVEVLKRGEETALEHGSGLGLWLVKWGIDQFNGRLEFESDEEGTRVSIFLPEELVSTKV